MPTLKENKMQITANEIDIIEDAGTLNNLPVKLIRTKGGLWLAVGRPKGKMSEEALTAGSHPAIVKFNLEKQYPDFQPAMMKSEHFLETTIVDKHSHFLSDELRKSGHDVYSVQNGIDIEFQITKHNSKVASVKGTLENDAIVIKDMNVGKEFSRALAGATVEKVVSSGASRVRIQGK